MNERILKANKLLEHIGGHGRNFFLNRETNKTSYFLKRKSINVSYYDSRSEKEMRVVFDKKQGEMKVEGEAFTNGGTLRGFIEVLAEYIKFNEKLKYGTCGMLSKNYWCYGEDGHKVANYAVELGIMEREVA